MFLASIIVIHVVLSMCEITMIGMSQIGVHRQEIQCKSE